MDSNDDSEGILVIDDQNSSSEDVPAREQDVHSFQGCLAKFSNGAGGNSTPGISYSREPEVVDLVNCDESESSPEKAPTSNWNHPKLKRKFEGDSIWGSLKKVKPETETPDKNDPSLNSNGTEGEKSVNTLKQHTFAPNVSSSEPVSPTKSVPELSSPDIKEEGLEKMQLKLSALCTVLYSLQKKEVVSITIDQFCNLTESLQSSLGISTNNSSSSVHLPRVGSPRSRGGKASNRSHVNLSSSSGLQFSQKKKNATAQQESNPPEISFSSLQKPEHCVCSKPCICSLVFESNIISQLDSLQPKMKLEPVVTSTSNSDDNLPAPVVKKVERRGRPRKNKPKEMVDPPKSPPTSPPTSRMTSPRPRGRPSEVKKEKIVVKEEVSSSIPLEVHQCPPDCKYGKDLLVFAKWPADKIYYPAIVHGCFYTDWEYSNNLSIQFFDGATVTMSSCNIFPASLVIRGSIITYKNDQDEYIDGTVESVVRFHPVGSKKTDTCLSFMIECTEDDDPDFGKVLKVPYTLVALNDHCYRHLKKTIGETVLTPHKFSRKTYNVCHDNLIEGKRKRRGVEEAVALILSEEANKSESSKASSNGGPGRKRKKREYSDEFANVEEEKHAKRKRGPTLAVTPPESKMKTGRGARRISVPISPQEVESADETSECTSNKREKNGGKLDRSQIPSTSTTKRPTAVRELVFRKDVVSEEEHTDSEPEDDFDHGFDISGVGGGDIDYECTTYTRTSRKSCGNRVVKSSSKVSEKVLGDDESLVNRYGPIPKSPLFNGYLFVLTHGGQNSYYKNKELFPDTTDSELSSDDEESQLFDHMRLKNQILAGKGQVYSHLLSISKDSLSKTIVITDFYCRTANYLLAAALNVPVYSHQIIIQCCIQNVPLEDMLQSERPLLVGVTSDRVRHKFTKKRKVNAMKSYMVILASTESNQRLKYWTKLIRLSGGKISYFTPVRNVIGGMVSLASVVIVDDYCTSELMELAKKNTVPIVSTKWLVDTIIRGHKQTMLSTDLPQYRVDLIMPSQPLAALSESQ